MFALEPKEFFCWKKKRTLIDLRPRTAFNKGSMAGAISLPEEKFNSIQQLIRHLKGLNNKFPIHLIDLDGKLASSLAPESRYTYLKGGYKNFKAFREAAFSQGSGLHVIGGYTGSGKTLLLQQLKEKKHQVIDLEDLAIHKGSAFGNIYNSDQPLDEDFRNNLLKLWLSFSEELPVWMEEKGPFLGRAGIPKSLYDTMQRAKLILLEVPFEERLNYLLQTYGNFDSDRFTAAIKKLEARMGTSNTHKALHFHQTGQKKKCFELLLRYYDRAYAKRRNNSWKGELITIPHSHMTVANTISKLESL